MKDDSEGFGLSNWINDVTIQLPEEKEEPDLGGAGVGTIVSLFF